MIYRGTIIGLFQVKGGSGLGMLGIQDDVRGRVLIPCDGNPTVRVFNEAFPGTLRDGRFHNDAITGERIYYGLDDLGLLKSFSPEDRASVEMVAQYERQSAPPPKKVRFINEGLCKPDDPIYSTGPIVAGRRILDPPKKDGTGKVIVGGLLPPDHPIFGRGPMIFGRPDPPKKKSTDN
jgi:hypothetical protein